MKKVQETKFWNFGNQSWESVSGIWEFSIKNWLPYLSNLISTSRSTKSSATSTSKSESSTIRDSKNTNNQKKKNLETHFDSILKWSWMIFLNINQAFYTTFSYLENNFLNPSSIFPFPFNCLCQFLYSLINEYLTFFEMNQFEKSFKFPVIKVL